MRIRILIYTLILTICTYSFGQVYSIDDLKSKNSSELRVISLFESIDLSSSESFRNDLIAKRLSEKSPHHLDQLLYFFFDSKGIDHNTAKSLLKKLNINNSELKKNMVAKFFIEKIENKIRSNELKSYILPLKEKLNKRDFKELGSLIRKDLGFKDISLQFFLDYFYHNSSLVVRKQSFHRSNISPVRLKGNLQYNAVSGCRIENFSINHNEFSLSTGRKCKPAGSNRYRKEGYVKNSLSFSQKNLKDSPYSLVFFSSMSAKGGYTCKSYAAGPYDCKDKVSYARTRINGKVDIPACEDLYTCSTILFSKKLGPDSFKITSTGKNGYFLRSQSNFINLSYDQKVRHNGYSGEKVIKHHGKLTLYEKPLRPSQKIATFKESGKDTYSLISKANLFINTIYDITNFTSIQNYLRMLKNKSQRDPKEQNNEIFELYSILFFNDHFFTDLKSVEFTYLSKVLRRSIINRLFEIRFNQLDKFLLLLTNKYDQNIQILDLAISSARSLGAQNAKIKELIDTYPELIQGLDLESLDSDEFLELLEVKKRNILFMDLTKIKSLVKEYSSYVNVNNYESYLVL